MAKSDNIDEKIVPYVEGVLNEKEERSVSHALSADPEMARDAQEVKEAIRSLRGAFEAGVRPSFEASMTESEVVKFACGTEDLEPAERRRLGLLFAESKAAQAEFDLLRELDDELENKVEAPGEIPAMPKSLKAEFRSLYGSDGPAEQGAGFLARLTVFLGALNPKPFVAVATCLVAVTVGIHFYSPTYTSAPTSEVALREGEATPGFGADTGTVVQDEAAELAGEGAEAPAAAGDLDSSILVTDTRDAAELREKARQLLDNEVRYTVRGQSIYVEKDQLEKANEVLGTKVPVKESNEDRKLALVTGKQQKVEKFSKTRPEEQDVDERTLKAAELPETVARQAAPSVSTAEVKAYRPVAKKQSQPEPPAPPVPGAAPAPAASKPSEGGDGLLQSRRGVGGVGATMKQPLPPGQAEDSDAATRPRAIEIPKTAWQRADAVPIPSSQGMSQMQVKLDANKGKASPQDAPVEEERASTTRDRSEQEGWSHVDAVKNSAAKRGKDKAEPAKEEGSFRVAGGRTGVTTNVALEDQVQLPPRRSNRSYSTEPSAPAVPDQEVALARRAQEVASEFNAVASVETRDEGGRAVYVRLNEPLDEAGVERLRTELRRRLGLDDTDTIIIRQP